MSRGAIASLILIVVAVIGRGRIVHTLGQCQTKVIHCQSDDTFPTFDGSCNNRKHPHWGATGTPLARMLSAEYDDGSDAPRTRGASGRLPSPRAISNAMNEDTRESSRKISHLHVLWGQFLTHDFVHTPMVKKKNGDPLNCECQQPHAQCINIRIPKNDEQFRRIRKTCMKLPRSKPAKGINRCEFDQREQINTLSSTIDGSMLYGRTWGESQELRDPKSDHGSLKTYKNPTKGYYDLLPTQDDMKKASISTDTDCKKKVHKPVHRSCFVAGDVRNNENSGLTSITTTWVRYHNKISKQLYSINPHWDSNDVFNVTREIMSAALQIITYREYLPHLVGPKYMRRFGLSLAENGYWNGYDSKYNPAVTNEFTTAAFRYGHSQVAGSLSRPGSFFDKDANSPIKSEDTWFNAEPLWNKTGGGVGSIMRGFMIDSAEQTDGAFVDDLRNQLFTEFGKRYGDDLFSINIQRGRDHGLPGYNKYRGLCGLKRAHAFEDLSGEIPYDRIEKLKKVYYDVNDIDLYPGGLAETHVAGAEVGPTFACILSYGFRAMKKGDRYWHEYEFSPSAFTTRQLEALRKITYARVLCDVAEEMKHVIKDPMLHSYNVRSKMTRCEDIPELDLSAWDEKRGHYYYGGSRQDEELTTWFVTRATSAHDVNRHAVLQDIEYKRPGESCSNVLDYEVRSVPRDDHAQIRFSCPVGSILATDFPRQLNDQHHWTDWMLASTAGFKKGYKISISEFNCVSPVAIQAMTVDGSAFARETGDVFEYYDVKRGFSCLDKHQKFGECARYQVRVLCGYGTDSDLYSETARPLASHKPKYRQTKPVTTTAPPTSDPAHVPAPARARADMYCVKYGRCCGYGIYTIYSIPAFVRKETSQMCEKYKICCD